MVEKPANIALACSIYIFVVGQTHKVEMLAAILAILNTPFLKHMTRQYFSAVLYNKSFLFKIFKGADSQILVCSLEYLQFGCRVSLYFLVVAI